MASGGFHGGSSHSGSFHSSGGGGGFHSSGGGGGGYSSGGWDSYGDDDGDSRGHFIILVVLVVGFIIVKVCSGEIPGLNLANFFVFVASGFILYFGINEYERTAAIKAIKKNGPYKTYGRIWSKEQLKKVTDGKSWYGDGRSYEIHLYDHDFGDENAKKVYELIKRTPKIVWISPYKLLVCEIISFLVNFVFYEMVIPVFENAVMTDLAFAFVDFLVFFFPSTVCLILSIYSLIVAKIKDKLLYECAVRIVNDNKATVKRADTEGQISSVLSRIWYYNNCPNCGAKATEKDKVCSHCGSSLEADFNAAGRPTSFHRVLDYNKRTRPVSKAGDKEKTDK